MRFRPTEQRIYDVLLDGYPHPIVELCKAIDELAEFKTLSVHLTGMRRVMRPAGWDIICREGHYQLVRLMRTLAE